MFHLSGKYLLHILFTLLIAWLTLIWTAPLLVSSDYPVLKYIGTTIYFFMDPVCHQLPQRSLFIAGLPMPVCGRCFYIYLGGALTAGTAVLRNKVRAWPQLAYIVLSLLIVSEIALNKWVFPEEVVYLRYAGGFLLGVLLFRLLTEGLFHKGMKEKEGTVT